MEEDNALGAFAEDDDVPVGPLKEEDDAAVGPLEDEEGEDAWGPLESAVDVCRAGRRLKAEVEEGAEPGRDWSESELGKVGGEAGRREGPADEEEAPFEPPPPPKWTGRGGRGGRGGD